MREIESVVGTCFTNRRKVVSWQKLKIMDLDKTQSG